MESFIQQQAIESLINTRVDQAIQRIREEFKSFISTELQSVKETLQNSSQPNTSNQDIQPFVNPPQFNYLIEAPDNGPESAIGAEINLESSTLHVLGLQNKVLKWVSTQDC
jgi:hypothetical protein